MPARNETRGSARDRRRAQGKCIQCGYTTDRYRCDRCRKMAAEYVKTHSARARAERREKGLCIECGKYETGPTHARCPACRVRNALSARKRREARARRKQRGEK